jgi:hypothetical protein
MGEPRNDQRVECRVLEAVTAREIEKVRISDFAAELLCFALVEPQRSLIVGFEAKKARQQEQSRDEGQE